MALEPMMMLSAVQANTEIKAYRRRYAGADSAATPHDILVAYATPLVGTSMLSTVATTTVPTSEDLTDPSISPEWRKKFQQLAESFTSRVIREALPNFDALQKDEVAHVRLQEGWNRIAPAKRPYKMYMVELIQLRAWTSF
ncbi:hypothetical protein CYMTET_42667 [Cymbomonas tetramitiformis]|uniref:Uncharacterized protein n=1 Tax=Cymbomonas tetramitiformis TaxID=36881 RepID=A0AAE0C3Q8_9CHLO|nr:hypothetical protein CYMTET_42667 [Cymbomonas tetramitiformis]|eukprot:gene34107-biopygen12760